MIPRLALGIGNAANLQVVSLDTYTHLPLLDYQTSNTAQWSTAELPDPGAQTFTTLAAGSGNESNLQVVMLGQADGQPYLYWQAAGNGIWTGPVPLIAGLAQPGGFSRVALAPGSNGFLQALLLGCSDGLIYACQQNPANGSWSGPVQLGVSNIGCGYKDFAAGIGHGGALQVIALTAADSFPVVFSQNSSGAWSGPQGLPYNSDRAYDTLATGIGSQRNLQVILLGLADGQPYLLGQDYGTGVWSTPAPLLAQPFADGFSALGLGSGNDGNLQVVLVGSSDGQPYLVWQAEGNGIWSSLAPLVPGRTLPRTAEVVLLQAYSEPDGSINLQVVLRAAGENSLRLVWQDDDGNWRYYGRLSSPSWMQDLATSLANKPLNNLLLPGTHDSATYGITSASAESPDAPVIVTIIKNAATTGGIGALSAIPGVGVAAAAIAAAVIKSRGSTMIADWAVAQNFTVAQQLRAGIRYLDIRVGKTGSGALWIMHGLFSVPLTNVLTDISNFLAKHPQEILILDFNDFGGFLASDYAALKATLAQQFGAKLASTATVSPTSTVQQFLDAGARVIITWRPGDSTPGVSRDQSAPSPVIWTDALQSNWPNQVTLDGLRGNLVDTISKRPAAQFWVLQGIFTPDAGLIVGSIFGPPRTLRALARGVSPAVTGWLNQPGWGSALNIVIIDHVEDCPAFLETVIDLNLSPTAPAPAVAPTNAPANAWGPGLLPDGE